MSIPTHLQNLTITSRVTNPFNHLVRDWQSCTACGLCQRRKQVVFARGTMPATVCFIGEAPGRSEDAVGYPFVGRSGELLQHWIDSTRKRLGRTLGPRFSYCIINVVGCLPESQDPDEDNQWDIRAPTESEAAHCANRLQDLIYLTQPRTLILLGKTAEKLTNTGTYPTLALWHPSYVLRNGGKGTPKDHETILRLTEHLKPFLHKNWTRKP